MPPRWSSPPRPALLLLLTGLAIVHQATASKVLFIAPLGTKSHMHFFGEIATTLADHGHQITMISSYAMKKHPNITQVDVKMPIDDYMPNNFVYSHWTTSFKLFSMVPQLCRDALGNEAVQQLNVEDFDLVYISAFLTDCFLALLDDAEMPFIIMSPNLMVTYLHEMIGSVDFPSFVTMMGLTGIHPLSFPKRALNAVLNVFSLVTTRHFYLPKVQLACEEAGLCKVGATPLDQIALRASLMMINSVRSLEVPPRPHVPAVIHAGGLNCRPAEPLPKELESWFQESGDSGVIFLSLGSAVKPSDMPEKYRKILIKVFGSLPQRVLWKWDQETMDDLPSNVKLAKWLPQQDILGHPKVKLFISHGGLFSTFESIYHGVPVLGMPVFADQATNIDRVVSEGYGEHIEWDDLTEELFRDTIHKLISDDRYLSVVKERSAVMRDQPMSPQETVLYWTEYVIRHKGAPHLSSPVKDMPWYQLYNVDVWLVLGLVVLALLALELVLLKCFISWVYKRCIRQSSKVTGATRQKKHKRQ